jgi:hypothetical protein
MTEARSTDTVNHPEKPERSDLVSRLRTWGETDDDCDTGELHEIMTKAAHEIERLQRIDRDFHNIDDVAEIAQLRKDLAQHVPNTAALIKAQAEIDRLNKKLSALALLHYGPAPDVGARICCHKCAPQGISYQMILCPTCGNKRCPKASDHDLACTNSNEPGQPGSVY